MGDADCRRDGTSREDRRRDDSRSPGRNPRVVRTFTSAEMFAGAQEVIIEHGDEVYRLRSTRNGKLILNK